MQDAEYLLIKRKVKELVQVDLDNYKSNQVQRRLSSLLARSGYPNWQGYFEHLQQDAASLQAFKNYLTINVSEFFRDPPKWEYVAQSVIPKLLRERPNLRIWSAGCSHGAEPYTLAMLLTELSPRHAQHTILATDIDQAMLDTAQAGGPYHPNEVRNVSAQRQQRYFELRGDRYWVLPELRKQITFRQHNLLEDPFQRDWDLIVCRNVVIYFVEETKRRLYQRFADALRTGGILFVGGTEIVPTLPSLGLKNIYISFYRKQGAV